MISPWQKSSSSWVWLYYVSVVIAGVCGAVLFLTALKDWQILEALDPTFGISTHRLLIIGAAMHFGVLGWVILSRSSLTQSYLILWLGLNQAAYLLLDLAFVQQKSPILRAIGMNV